MSSTTGRPPYSRKQLTGLILGLALFVVILLLPLGENLTPVAQRMAAVAILMASWWITEAIPIPATAFLPLVLFPALGIMPMGETSANYANQLVFLFLGGFLIAAAMVKWDLHKRIALLTIRLFGTGPYRIVFGFMVAAAFLSMWISNTATAMMMVPIGMAVVDRMSKYAELDSPNGNDDVEELVKTNLGLALMLGIAYGASIGGIGTLIGTPPNGVFVGMLNSLYKGEAPVPSFGQWMVMAVPLVLLMLPIAWLIVTRVAPGRSLSSFRFSGVGKQVIASELKKLGPMSPGEKKIAIIFVMVALAWLTRKPIPLGFMKIPGWSQFTLEPSFWTDSTVAMLAGVLLFVLPAHFKEFSHDRSRRHNFVLDWGTARNNIPWGVLFLFGGGFALAAGFARSGLSQIVGGMVQQFGWLPLAALIVMIAGIMTFLTEMTSNTATTTLILPILAVASVNLGYHPFLLMIPATLSASCAFMLPVATPPNAIVFGSRWVTIPKMTKAGIWLNLVGIILITFVTLFLATAVFGINLDVLPDWALAIGN